VALRHRAHAARRRPAGTAAQPAARQQLRRTHPRDESADRPHRPRGRRDPMTADRSRAARDLWRLLEPIHAVTYFSPEPIEALAAAGYRGFWMGYFAGRTAPLGPAPAELVHALFHNFAYARVARALPAA